MRATTVKGWLRKTVSPDLGRTTSNETLAMPCTMKARTPTTIIIKISSKAGPAQSQKVLGRLPFGIGVSGGKSSGGKLGGMYPSEAVGVINSGDTIVATSAGGSMGAGRGSGFIGVVSVSGSGESASDLCSGCESEESSGKRLPSFIH